MEEYYKGWFSERELAAVFARAAERDGATVQAGRAAKAAMRTYVRRSCAAACKREGGGLKARTEWGQGNTGRSTR